jgi:hypothetical protein
MRAYVLRCVHGVCICACVRARACVQDGSSGENNVRVVLEAEDAEEASLWVDLLNHAIEDHATAAAAPPVI